MKKKIKLFVPAALLCLAALLLSACGGDLGCAAAEALDSGEFYVRVTDGEDESHTRGFEIAEKDGAAVLLTDGVRILLRADGPVYAIDDDAGEYSEYAEEGVTYENVYVRPGSVKAYNSFTAGDGDILCRNYDIGDKRILFVFIKNKLSRIRYELRDRDGKTVLEEATYDVVAFQTKVPAAVTFDISEHYTEVK